MKHSDMPQNSVFTNKMKVDFDVFSALMLHWVAGHVHRTYIVAKHDDSFTKRMLELRENLSYPRGLSHGIGDGTILCFSTRTGDRVLALGGPRHKVISEKMTKTRWASRCIAHLISINVSG